MNAKNRLGAYLAVTAGAGCAASIASGSVVFYEVNAANDTGNADPLGIDLFFQSGQSHGVGPWIVNCEFLYFC